jgi:hypothetical protein
MATWQDVEALATALPGVEETTRWGNRTWAVQRGFVWERPLRQKEIAEHGEEPGPILAARVAHEHEKQAILAEDVAVFFTVSHFDGHPTVLVRLDRIGRSRLEELIVAAWAEVAPHRVVAEWLAEHPSTLG